MTLKLHGAVRFASYMISQPRNLLEYLLHTINFIMWKFQLL